MAVTNGPRKYTNPRSASNKHAARGNSGRLTRSGEHRLEQRLVLSIVRLAFTSGTPNAPITATEQETGPSGTELSKHRADRVGVVARNRLLVISVRGRDGLGNLRLSGHVFEPIKVRFVCIGCGVLGIRFHHEDE